MAQKKSAKKKAKTSAKKSTAKTRKPAVAKPTKPHPKKAKAAKAAAVAPVPVSDGKLTFNHAMIYSKDVARSLGFYKELLGFKLVEDFRYEGKPVYARLRAPGGDGTIAIHLAGPSDSMASGGVRLYFEIRDLDDFCHKLLQKGFYITQMPRTMPWGWRHAYLNDPDAHEISLYWAGENRMKKTLMKAASK
jgi:catechol 2,3-dioxygenase-like lactoylglutathione lyase family enzyme